MLVTPYLVQAALPWPETPPVVTAGRIERLSGIASRHIDARPVDVWMPSDYKATKRYAVLYMQDAQSLFDARQTWNKAAWNVHEAVNKAWKESLQRIDLVMRVRKMIG